ncbi:MAG: response regulator transcription factor [Erysipelotrichia bacterium]|nr:response regulator transcription factor [Erysipelotrichia bacterium]NCC55119.1 response regulator transcription factor [Erysipelotrichia bacterium]
MNKILIVEDDVTLRNELKLFLNNNGYEVEILADFQNALTQILAKEYNLILMDINIPGLNGEYLCREIRKNSTVPIVMVTSRNNEIDEIMSMSYGADDYITKPYNPQILLVRIEAILKRVNRANVVSITYKDFKLNLSKSVIERATDEIELSKNEAKILYFLLKNKGRIIAREEIMDFLWGSDEFVDDNTLTVNINRLRRKLQDIGYEDIIETKRGQGYMIV